MSGTNHDTKQDFATIRRIVRARKTAKVLADPTAPLEFDDATRARCDPLVREAMVEAGWAPFHYKRAADDLSEPWRATLLWQRECRVIADRLDGWIGAEAPVGKLPAMFAACGAAALVTWVPQFRDTDVTGPEQEKRRAVDDEHLAATAALVQNALLLLTAAGFGTYWSSAGAALRHPDVLGRLGVAAHEELLALLFVEYPGTPDDLPRKPGKNRDARSTDWLRETRLD